MSDFKKFAGQVHERFNWLSAHELYHVALTGDDLWVAYLSAFPPFTNPVFRQRTEHDGSYDRSVMKRIGNVVALVNGKVETLWQIEADAPYNEVCAILDAKVRAAALTELFRVKEDKFGYQRTTERLENGSNHYWYHYHVNVASRHRKGFSPEAEKGKFNTDMGVFTRALTELSLDALDTVLALINDNNLYRGSEFKSNVEGFRKLKAKWLSLDKELDKNRFIFHTMSTERERVTLMRNDVIGTLVTELSEGVPLDRAVGSFESKVAPHNYRRTTALVTPRMIEDAQKTIDELGLADALERRFATLADVSADAVLWVGNDVRNRMKGGIADMIGQVKVNAPDKVEGKATDVGVGEFIVSILPTVTSLEVLFRNRNVPNLMSLTAPVIEDAPRLFKWSNPFAWSYNGNITDSAITERVKTAGGNVNAKVRVSLAWSNHDDLDLHVQCPNGHIYYGHKSDILDVDMNAGYGMSRTPVENLSWANPKAGEYVVSVNQFCKREASNNGFTIETSFNGDVSQYSHAKDLRDRTTIEVVRFKVDSRGNVSDVKVSKELTGGGVSEDVWGIKTETFVKVNSVMFSPNHWDENASGNMHYIFALEGCLNDQPTRGFYNEFLLPELDKHRKVFEVLGDKTKCAPAQNQVSGLGFSHTKRDTLTVRVATNKRSTQLFNINF